MCSLFLLFDKNMKIYWLNLEQFPSVDRRKLQSSLRRWRSLQVEAAGLLSGVFGVWWHALYNDSSTHAECWQGVKTTHHEMRNGRRLCHCFKVTLPAVFLNVLYRWGGVLAEVRLHTRTVICPTGGSWTVTDLCWISGCKFKEVKGDGL